MQAALIEGLVYTLSVRESDRMRVLPPGGLFDIAKVVRISVRRGKCHFLSPGGNHRLFSATRVNALLLALDQYQLTK